MSSFFAHDTSIVDDNVKIGNDTKIWHFSHILSGSNIGTNCSFGQKIVVHSTESQWTALVYHLPQRTCGRRSNTDSYLGLL